MAFQYQIEIITFQYVSEGVLVDANSLIVKGYG